MKRFLYYTLLLFLLGMLTGWVLDLKQYLL